MIRLATIVVVLGVIVAAITLPSRPDSFFSVSASKGFSFFESKDASLVFVGDIMLSRAIGELIEENNTYFPYVNVREYISSFDIAFANLENPVSLQGKNVGSIYSFRAHPQTLVGLKDAGFDIVSFANNHVFDYGPVAFLDTLEHLKKIGIGSSGAGVTRTDAHEPYIISKNGVEIAYLSYSQFASPSQKSGEKGFAVGGIDEADLENDISNARAKGADIVVTSFHWGEEYETKHNAYQERVAYAAVNAGADLVVGHHPHVIQDHEWYKGSFIAYSLGNFIFDQNFSKDTREGGVLEVEIENKKLKSAEIKKVKFTKEYQPYFESN